MPHLIDWLKIASPVKDVLKTFYPELSGEARQKITEKENVLAQLKNIQTYPFVQEMLIKGFLFLHGWYYDIGTGDVYSYNPNNYVFEKII